MQHDAVKLIQIDKLAEIVGGRYPLTVLVAKRVREINAGANVLVEEIPGERALETACREIEAGKIWFEKPMAQTAEEQDDEAALDDIAALMDMDVE